MPFKYATEEERLEAKKRSQEKYRQSAKGKEYIRKRNQRIIENRKIDDEAREKYNAYQRRRNQKIRKEKNNLTDEQIAEKNEKRRIVLQERAIKKKESSKKWKEKNKGKVQEYKHTWYEQNKDKSKEYNKQYYEQHKAEIAERKRLWRLNKLNKVDTNN